MVVVDILVHDRGIRRSDLPCFALLFALLATVACVCGDGCTKQYVSDKCMVCLVYCCWSLGREDIGTVKRKFRLNLNLIRFGYQGEEWWKVCELISGVIHCLSAGVQYTEQWLPSISGQKFGSSFQTFQCDPLGLARDLTVCNVVVEWLSRYDILREWIIPFKCSQVTATHFSYRHCPRAEQFGAL